MSIQRVCFTRLCSSAAVLLLILMVLPGLQSSSSGVAQDSSDNRFLAVQPYKIANFGANYWAMTSVSGPITIGHGRIQPAQGNATPDGVAVLSYRSKDVLVSEAAVPASPLLQAGRIYAESNSVLRTGVAIANPNDQSATVSFYFTDKDGFNFNSGTMTLGSRQQVAAFLDEPPFLGNVDARSFTFTSS